MILLVVFLKPFVADVSVDLGGGDVGMPEHFLNGSQVRPTTQKMSGKRMPQSITCLFGDP